MSEGERDLAEGMGNGSVPPDKRLTSWMEWRVRPTATLLVIAALLAILPVQVCRDRTYICENTGSHRGYRQWLIGWRTGEWHRESHLEQFLRRQHPSELTHRWAFWFGVGKNLLGWTGMREDGVPRLNAAMRLDWFDSYVDILDDAGKLELYSVLASGDPNAIKAEEKKIETAMIRSWEPKSGSDSAK